MIVDSQVVASDLGSFLVKAEGGETIVIAVHDRPVAELRPTSVKAAESRPWGLCKGVFVVPDDFDSSLPSEILDDFEPR